ncbi:MAG TPA: hypothetical protein VL308_08085, partial [Gemmatimonadaceae bacterium]|nr:hypothetical protein [Gemmatimonadaceae bacterium]
MRMREGAQAVDRRRHRPARGMFPWGSRDGIPNQVHHFDRTPEMTTNRLNALHEVGQSIWLDFID